MESKMYIGTKVVQAVPMNGSMAYAQSYRVSQDHIDQNVEGYEVTYPDGYKSWSPKDVFDESYRPSDGLTFGLALEQLKVGSKIARLSWLPIGKYIVVRQACVSWNIEELEVFEDAKKPVDNIEGVTHVIEHYPAICCRDHNGRITTGWAPSQFEMFVNDWVVL